MATDGFKGRGTAENPGNRFETIRYEPDQDEALDQSPDSQSSAPTTQFFRDRTQSILAYNDSPDVGFSASINPYRGCEHGCVYCYARPYHEYLGMSAGLDFETKILVKENAPRLLRSELAARSWQPQVLGISGVTDCYQPIERKLQLTRQCLEVLADFRNPAVIVTKNRLVTRDIDVLKRLAEHQAVIVFLSITTLDAELARIMEPRTTQPEGRLAAVQELRDAGIPVGIMLAPLIPGLNDHEMPEILTQAAASGAGFAGYTVLRLPHGVGELFESWLERHFPNKKPRVLARLRDLRGGKLNEANFGSRMRGDGPLAQIYRKLFDVARRRAGIPSEKPNLSADAFRRPNDTPLSLFE